MGVLDWLFGPRDDTAQCNNKAPHGAHTWYEETVPDNAYGYDVEEYHCEGVK